MEEANQKEWDLIIRPSKGIFQIEIKEILRKRDLIGMFVKRDFIALYKQTVLGPLWHFVQPLLTTITFTFIFGRVAKISTDGIPQILFYMSGIVAWGFFAECLRKTSNVFIAN